MKTRLKHMVKRLAIAAMIGISGLTAFAGTAAADQLRIGIYDGDRIDVQYRDERDWERNRHHRPGWGRPDGRGRCAPWLAADKARSYGLRGARVVDVTQRRVVVEGRRYGDWRRVAFVNVRGCPTLR